ncbi:oligopeptide/dipeptide ABC transporter ATP-binding protein [Actinophytocola sp.]|uniref:oligopeptide/dipeptide ABC transporter ATP-binding protein n=1 Tax=Actinophytocola sp. TaxID=1872138 RepID=UPI003D6AC1F3
MTRIGSWSTTRAWSMPTSHGVPRMRSDHSPGQASRQDVRKSGQRAQVSGLPSPLPRFTCPQSHVRTRLPGRIDSEPRARRPRRLLTGDLPNPVDRPTGCAFRGRCWKSEEVCTNREPILLSPRQAGHAVACHVPE